MTSIFDQMRGTGKVAVVSGGTGWLGSAISEALAEAGFEVFTLSRGKSGNFLPIHPNIRSIEVDLSSEQGCKDALVSVDRSVDVLVNNSYSWPQKVHFQDQTWEDISSTLQNGFVSPLVLSRCVMTEMMQRGSGGSIINISSMYGHVSPDLRIYGNSGMGNAIEYGASKAAILQATRYLAVLGGPHKIRVNSISPGPFSRPGSLDGKEWFKENLEEKVPLARIGQPHELKGAVILLATDLGSYITGTDIKVDGGWTSW